MNDLQIDKVEIIMNDLINDEAYTHTQSINFLIDKMGELSVSMAFVNNQMAIAKAALNVKKVSAYNNLVTSSVANEKYFSPTQAKDYINGKLAKEHYEYDLCERCSRTIVHKIDSLRTAISALKLERDYGSTN